MGNKYAKLQNPPLYEDPSKINYQLHIEEIDKLLKQRSKKKIRNYFYDESINIQVTSIIALIHCGKITISDTLKESESFKRLENNIENRMLMHPRDIIYFLTFYKNE